MKIKLSDLLEEINTAITKYGKEAVLNVRVHNEEQFDTGFTDTFENIKIDQSKSNRDEVFLDIETIGY